MFAKVIVSLFDQWYIHKNFVSCCLCNLQLSANIVSSYNISVYNQCVFYLLLGLSMTMIIQTFTQLLVRLTFDYILFISCVVCPLLAVY